MAGYKKNFERSNYGIGQQNMQTMQALHKKYKRDYLPFFEELSSMYKSGKNKKELVETVNYVKKILTLLKDTIQEGRIEKEDADSIYLLVENIEQKKQYFLEEIQNVKAFQEKMEKVEEKIGISREDLNITKDVVQAGVAKSRKRSESTSSFLKRVAPTTYGLGSQALQGVGAAALGPFYGLAKAGLGVGGDILNVGRGLSERRQRKSEAGLRSGIRTSGSPVSSEGIASARGQSPGLGSFGGVSGRRPTLEQQTAPLNEFFDKGAYKAKWTKELLRTSKAAKKQSLGFLNNLKGGIVPIIAKFALLAVGLGNAILQFKKLGGAVGGYLSAKKGLAEAKQTMATASGTGRGTWEEELLKREDPIAALKKYKMEGKIAPQIAATLEKRMTPDYVQAHKKSVGWKKDAEDVKAMTEKITGRLGMGVKEKSSKGGIPTENLVPTPGIDDLNVNLKELVEQLKKGQFQDDSNSGKSGSVFDSADAMINNHANGNMTLGDN